MFSAEKWSIRLHNFFRNLMLYWAFWALSWLFFVFLTGHEEFFMRHFNRWQFTSLYPVLLWVSFGTSLMFSCIDGLFTYRLLRFFPLRLMLFLKSVLYLLSVLLLFLVSQPLPLAAYTGFRYEQWLAALPPADITLYRFLVYFYLFSFLGNLTKQMIRKIGRGNIRIWLLGLLNKPMEQRRIFMFVDMKKSTTIAEKLGHRKFSHLVQDVFNDMAVVDNYSGEIYQYVGDGAIISWSERAGVHKNNCLRAFYAFQRTVQRRSRYYKRRYGEVPQFKAGLHVGEVMVLQVGAIRKDISYNGDTLNTAARIESMCNEYRSELLLSADLYVLLNEHPHFTFKELEKVKLKGKRKAIALVQVKRKKK
ncbi:MAG: adenylate/guanylate cyclase domain-containing protein [Bacteroidales bacterium]|jgi:adenylate cyclase